ncbi:MAG: enoyl-CoA hydratase/isomerase family protein [Proteobacteria bacterium]|nr:enoyl-CoA hydratase/isomerase family protein [Pseudomonadota bacterium]
MSEQTITLEFDGPVAVMSNNRPEKHNAANDAMDARLWECLEELHGRDGLRAVVWRGNGKSFSSGRDVTELGVRTEDISDLEFIERGHRGTQKFFTLPAPIIVALKGWVIGGSFERSLLCDMRVAGESARMRLPEILHGVVPDTGGTARLVQMAGHGLAADLALTGRVMDAEEALRHGVVSRVVPDDVLDETVLEIAHTIAKAPAFTVKMFRRSLSRLVDPAVKASIQEEAVTQSMVFASEDYAEMKAARAEQREPKYRGR